MIKCNAKVCGVISRAASVKQTAGGKSFVTFGMAVEVPAKKGAVTPVYISVATDAADTSALVAGRKVAVGGQLRIKGALERKTFFNLSAESIELDSPAPQGITGEVTFTGTCSKDIATPTDRNGKRFVRFSAYSTDRVGEDFFSVFMRFVMFEEAIPAFVVPKARIEVRGDLRVSTFNGNLDLNCRIAEIKEPNAFSF